MMLFMRKLSHKISIASPSLLCLSHGGVNYNIVGDFGYQFHVYSICKSFFGFGRPCLASLEVEAVPFGTQAQDVFPAKLFSTMTGTILVQARDPAKLSVDIQNALDEHQLKDAWNLYEKHMLIDGFPRKSVVNKLLATFAESLDVQWLEKAYGLAERAFEKGKQNLLERETLIYLSFALAKAGLPVPASILLRKLVEIKQFPPASAWSAILVHMLQTGPGAYLAAELVLETGYLFQDGRIDPRKKSNKPLIAMKPNATAFNIALAGGLLFGTTRKAEQLLEMMPRIGVRSDANLLIIMAHIYERNGRVQDLKKLQRYIDETHKISDAQYRQFYNCLLSCHLKLGDLESASNMVLEMLRKAKAARNSLAVATLVTDAVGSGSKSPLGPSPVSSGSYKQPCNSLDSRNSRIPMISFEEYSKDQSFLELEAEAKKGLDILSAKLQNQVEFVTTQRGIIQPTDRIFVKLVKAFLEAKMTKDLVLFLIKAEREDSPASNDDSALVHVINSCISLGWLDQAHDLLDEMRLAGVRVPSSIYMSLLQAYCQANRPEDVASLLQDARRAGVQLDSGTYEALIQFKVLAKDTHGALHLFKEMMEAKIPKAGHQEFEILVKGCEESGEARLMSKLLQEIKEGQREDSAVHEWNNVIHFFCKKKLMQDAQKALEKMRSLGHTPNAQTFHTLVTGYVDIRGKHTEVTELWGEMKSLASSTSMKFDQELLDAVLYTFVRGGHFVLANEVVEMMEKGNMFVDKYKYRTLLLKYHETLYKGKAPKFQSESKLEKRKAALALKKWVGLC